tara:strand:+ start:441 stop:638 length:198 start_codon:yes stop_codon:yes gene_type:complete
MAEYNMQLNIRTCIQKIVEADSLEEAEDKIWQSVIDMDPKQGHYILANGVKTYEHLNQEDFDDKN